MTISKQEIDNLKKLRENKIKYEEELEKIRINLFNELCLKSDYKKDCDISYCVFWITNQCKYPTEWKKILRQIEKG